MRSTLHIVIVRNSYRCCVLNTRIFFRNYIAVADPTRISYSILPHDPNLICASTVWQELVCKHWPMYRVMQKEDNEYI
jgi:hypothetical protein